MIKFLIKVIGKILTYYGLILTIASMINPSEFEFFFGMTCVAVGCLAHELGEK